MKESRYNIKVSGYWHLNVADGYTQLNYRIFGFRLKKLSIQNSKSEENLTFFYNLHSAHVISIFFETDQFSFIIINHLGALSRIRSLTL